MNPYYQDDSVTLYYGDCRDVLPQLSGPFFVWCDPPYNAKKDYHGWNDDMPEPEYLAFCADWIGKVKRLATEICIYSPKKYLPHYWHMLGFEYQQVIIKKGPEGAMRAGFVDQFSTLLTNAVPKEHIKNVWEKVQQRGNGYFFKENDYDHPGYTSEDLTGRVLRYLADPALPVLDPFGGSGTTARVAKNMGRKCVTIEYSEYWCEFIANERLAQMMLFSQVSP